MEEEKENKETLRDLMKRNNELLAKQMGEEETKKKKFKFKFPRKGRVPKNKLKKNWVTIQKINENGTVEFDKAQIENGTIMVDKVPRMVTAEFVTTYKGKPLVIIPSWSIAPFSPAENYEKTVQDKLTTAGRRLIIERMQREAIDKKKMGFGMIGWVIVGIVLLGVGYYLFKGGKLF